MWVGRQSRRVCFGAKPDKGFLDMKSRRIRKWKGDAREAVDGGPGRELTTRPSRGQLAAGQREAVDDATEQRAVGGWTERVEQRGWRGSTDRGVNTRHRSREARQHGIGSSESESR